MKSFWEMSNYEAWVWTISIIGAAALLCGVSIGVLIMTLLENC
ncbi:MAG TPA: hypothetical protein VEA38_25505 [Terriglobales bacterium]|nr:hypothetical protein [Terriglobales bacterium]